MSSFTQNLPTNDRWYSWDNVKQKVKGFNEFAGTALQTAGNVSSLYNLASLGIGSITGAIESNRRQSVDSAIGSLNTMSKMFSSNPESFTDAHAATSQRYLDRIQGYTDTYSRNPMSEEHKNLISKYQDIGNEYRDIFNPATFADRRQQLIAENNRAFMQQSANLSSLSDNYRSTMNEIDSTKDYVERPTILNPLTNRFSSEIPRDFDNAFNEYKANRKINTKEGISNSLNAIRKATDVVRQTKSSEALKVLMDMKYDYAVRSYSWRS